MMDLDKIVATLATAPKLAQRRFYDVHLGCGCAVGHLAIAAGFPVRDLIALDQQEREQSYADSTAISTRLFALLEREYRLFDYDRDGFYDLNDAIDGETPMQRAERVRAALPAAAAEWYAACETVGRGGDDE